ncbi:Ig-like domain-containing protein [Pseudomonas sp.]|jgi:hypothetical protein|uniref:Ig-like domain-containing protein n=1 Tax=Pseudomonas sp. TaxID=306 RepID=UPI002E362194|nr:Ig-like domain-containing protein [Pseudomonas sp.]HEX4548531.1 Ig-like domain-containing protein [Pseudomonas sp.]
MNDSGVLADNNLVLNGDFKEALTGWTKGHPSHDVRVRSDEYQGERISYLSALDGGSASQALITPKTGSDQARYVLTFLCENQYRKPGRLIIRLDTQNLEREFELEPGPARDEQQDNLRLMRGEPLAFVPKAYEFELNMPINEQEPLTVSVFSPLVESGDLLAGINITRINIRLELAPARLQTLLLDEQRLPVGRPLPLCLGATQEKRHTFGVELAPDDIWQGTEAALHSDDNPQEAIVAFPVWGDDHPLDDVWWLDCPVIGDQQSYEFTMRVENQYTAEPVQLNVSLGHHRVMFSQVQEAAYYPVLELGQSVRVGVQVASFYTGNELPGRTVSWSAVGQAAETQVVTDAQGWAFFDYQPTAAGDFAVRASVESLYFESGVFIQDLAVRVLATDPWKEIMAVVEGVATPWEDRIGYPNRGSDYVLQLKLPATSALLDTELSLYWSGVSHEQLGVDVSPALETPVNVANDSPSWTLTSEDRRDGQFELSLHCSKLLQRSPEKRMSLARNRVRIGEVREADKFPVVDENERVLLRIQVLHLLTSGDGDPVQNALVDWVTPEGTVNALTGSGGWASLQYQPTSDGNKDITARVRAHADAQADEHVFTVIAHATSPWKNEVRILLDEVEVDRVVLGMLCRRGESHVLKVVPVVNSTLLNENVTLSWRDTAPDIGLTVSDLGVARPLPAAGLQWTLASASATSRSGLFELKLGTPKLSVDRELSGRLFAADLSEELSVQLDEVVAAPLDNAFHPCLGATHGFNVLPNPLSPLVGLDMHLTWTGTPAEQLGAVVTPAPGTAVPVGDGGARWTLDFTASDAPGQFALAVSLPQLALGLGAHPMRLGHNKVQINAYREPAVDAVPGKEPVWLWVQVFSLYTRGPVAQVPVTWDGATSVDTDADGWSGFAFSPAAAGQQTVQALVTSLFDGHQEHKSLTVTALASDPWDDVKISFESMDEHPWGRKTFFPRRKGRHWFRISASEDNPLFGQEITLGLTGSGPAALGGISFDPSLGVPRSFAEMVGRDCTLLAGDLKDGSFALRLAATRLASLSPANAMSLGEGAQVYRLVVSASAQQTLDWGEELFEQVSVVSSISGRPMAGVEVTWRNADLGTVTGLTDFYGVSKIRFTPKTPGLSAVSVSAGDEFIALPFTLQEPRDIQALTSPKPNGHLGERMSAIVNVVSARTGEPLPDVEVTWEYPDRILAPTKTDAEGNARVEFRMPGIRTGVLQATVTGGYGGWVMETLVFTLIPNASLTGPVDSISSLTWLQEFKPHLNNACVRWLDLALSPVAGQPCTLTLDYEYSWLIGDRDAFLVLDYVPGAEAQGLKFDPPLGQAIQMAEGTASLSWTIRVEQASDSEFMLQFAIPAMPELLKSPKVKGRVVDEWPSIESLTHPNTPVKVGNDTTATIRVVNASGGSPLQGVEVQWSLGGQVLPSTVTDSEGFSRCVFTSLVLGDLSLTASIFTGDTASVKVTFIPYELKDFILSSAVVVSGEKVDASVRAVDRSGVGLANTDISWSYQGQELETSRTDSQGLASFQHSITDTPDQGWLVFNVEARASYLSRNSTGVITAPFADNDFAKNAQIKWKQQDLPPLTGTGTLAAGAFTQLAVQFNLSMIGREFAVVCTHPEIIPSPQNHVLRKLVSSVNMVWDIWVPATVAAGTQFAVFVYSPDFKHCNGFTAVVTQTESDVAASDEVDSSSVT